VSAGRKTVELGKQRLSEFRVVAGCSSWEEELDKPLDVWRKELNVEPIRKGQNSWYEVLADLQL